MGLDYLGRASTSAGKGPGARKHFHRPAAIFIFDSSGRVEECLEIRACIALEPDTVVFEMKSGPHSPTTDEAFPDWAPRAGSDKAGAYLAWLKAVFTQRGVAPA